MSKRLSIILFVITLTALIILFGITIYELRMVFKSLFRGAGDLQDAIDEYMGNVGVLRALLLMIMQFFSVIIAVMPAEPVQIVAGLSYGIGRGIMICWFSIIAANTVIYFMFKKLGDPIVKLIPSYEKWEGLVVERYKHGGRVANIAMLYILPFIPYGIIAYIASRSRLKFIPYLIVTSFGVLPSIVITTAISGSILEGNIYLTLGIIGIIVVAALVAWFIKRKFKIVIDNAEK